MRGFLNLLDQEDFHMKLVTDILWDASQKSLPVAKYGKWDNNSWS